jgi:hypothetical protein
MNFYTLFILAGVGGGRCAEGISHTMMLGCIFYMPFIATGCMPFAAGCEWTEGVPVHVCACVCVPDVCFSPLDVNGRGVSPAGCEWTGCAPVHVCACVRACAGCMQFAAGRGCRRQVCSSHHVVRALRHVPPRAARHVPPRYAYAD